MPAWKAYRGRNIVPRGGEIGHKSNRAGDTLGRLREMAKSRHEQFLTKFSRSRNCVETLRGMTTTLAGLPKFGKYANVPETPEIRDWGIPDACP